MYKLFKFLILGLIIYGINIGFTYILLNYYNIPLNIGYFISIIIVTSLNFISSLRFVFKKKFTVIILIKYLCFLLMFSGLNYLIVVGLYPYFQDNYIYAVIFIVTTLIFFLKFFTYDKYVFINNKDILG